MVSVRKGREVRGGGGRGGGGRGGGVSCTYVLVARCGDGHLYSACWLVPGQR